MTATVVAVRENAVCIALTIDFLDRPLRISVGLLSEALSFCRRCLQFVRLCALQLFGASWRRAREAARREINSCEGMAADETAARSGGSHFRKIFNLKKRISLKWSEKFKCPLHAVAVH